MTGDMLVAAILQCLLGAGLIALGLWGTRSAETLAARRTDEESRARAETSYRLGAITCQGVGVLLAGMGLLALMDRIA